jgi:hypothetical protein
LSLQLPTSLLWLTLPFIRVEADLTEILTRTTYNIIACLTTGPHHGFKTASAGSAGWAEAPDRQNITELGLENGRLSLFIGIKRLLAPHLLPVPNDLLRHKAGRWQTMVLGMRLSSSKCLVGRNIQVLPSGSLEGSPMSLRIPVFHSRHDPKPPHGCWSKLLSYVRGSQHREE